MNSDFPLHIRSWIQERFEHFLDQPGAHPIHWFGQWLEREEDEYWRVQHEIARARRRESWSDKSGWYVAKHGLVSWVQKRFKQRVGDPSAHPIDWCTDINRKQYEDYVRENGDDDDDDACNGLSGMNEEDYEDYMDDLDQNSSDEEEEETSEQEPEEDSQEETSEQETATGRPPLRTAVQATAAPTQVRFVPRHQPIRRDRDENKENEEPEEEEE